jgi:hypothetical protein
MAGSLEFMQRVPQMNPDVERAQRNREDTLRLLRVKQRERDFLEIGRLLDECHEYQYFRAFGCKSFKEYVESTLKTDYPAATRDRRIYQLTKRLGGPSADSIRKIGKGKMRLLLRTAERDQVTPELWEQAQMKSITYAELGMILKRYRPLGRPIPITTGTASRHKDIQERIKEIGEEIGRYAQTEYPSDPAKQYLFDVVWKKFEQAQGVTHVFEVCWGSPFKGDLPKLWYAYKNMGQPRLFLVVAREEDKRKAESLVSSGATAGDMAQNLAIRTAQQIEQLHEDLFRRGPLREFISLFMK